MWAAGVVDLGLTSSQFLEFTPREFDALFHRYSKQQAREDRRAALVAMYIANFAGRNLPDRKHLSISDVLGTGQERTAPTSDLERLMPTTDAKSAMERLMAQDPRSDTTMGVAAIETVRNGLGTWSKLGPEGRQMQPLNIALVMAGMEPIPVGGKPN